MAKDYTTHNKIFNSAKLLFVCEVKKNTFSDMQWFGEYTKNALFL